MAYTCKYDTVVDGSVAPLMIVLRLLMKTAVMLPSHPQVYLHLTTKNRGQWNDL